MIHSLKALYNDENGFIVSGELVLISTIAVLGLIVGLSEVAGNINNELEDIGSAFGSISDTTFQVPDMRGLFLRGVDQDSKRDPEAGLRQAPAPNGNAGDKVGSVQEDQLKTHKHTVNAAHAGLAGGRSTGDPIAVAGWAKNFAGKEVDAAGGAETRPKNIYVNWIIKAKHTLPLQP